MKTHRKIKERLMATESEMGREFRNKLLDDVLGEPSLAKRDRLALDVLFGDTREEREIAFQKYEDFKEEEMKHFE